MSDEEEELFIRGQFSRACEELGLNRVHPGEGGAVPQFERSDGLRILAHATRLGSLWSITVMLSGTDVVRTIAMTPEQANSVEFLKTHMINWVLLGGNYEPASAPHLQGLSKELQRKLLPFLDAQSMRSFGLANRELRELVRASGPIRSVVHAQRPLRMRNLVWERMDTII